MRDVTAGGGPGGAGGAVRGAVRAAGGWISFEEFMGVALYHPEHGYYARRVRTVGREGDFSTSATLHPALARAVAAWAARHRASVPGRGGEWHLVELGGGNGGMAAEVLGALGWWARRRVRYHLVEVSTGLRAAQRRRLAAWGGRVRWHEEMRDAVTAAGGRALVFSNEFVDAFPCARWVWEGDAAGWREIGVAWPDGGAEPVEERRSLAAVEAAGASSVLEPGFAAGLARGQRVEAHPAYRRWLAEWRPSWRGGRLLTIDYGDRPPALYHRRPAGTMRAYCRQERLAGAEIYRRIGQQDLTADVNFTDLERWGDRLGLPTVWYGEQAEFLRRWLPGAMLRRAAREPALAYLLDPAGAGGAFKVLEQVCDPGTPTSD